MTYCNKCGKEITTTVHVCPTTPDPRDGEIRALREALEKAREISVRAPRDAYGAIREVIDAALALTPGTGWIPVTTPPTTADRYNTWDGDMVRTAYWNNGWEEDESTSELRVTHWRPLPPAPVKP